MTHVSRGIKRVRDAKKRVSESANHSMIKTLAPWMRMREMAQMLNKRQKRMSAGTMVRIM